MRLLFAGTPEVALPALDAFLASEHEVVAVLTRPDAPSGRGRHLHPSPVAERAEAEGIEVLKPPKPSDETFKARLRELAPDCCPVVAYGGLLPQSVLDVPPQGWVNLHFSLLPAWRGAAPVQYAIRTGDDVTGASTFRIVKELDAGPVFGVLTEPIHPTDTAGELLDRLAVSGAKLLLDTIDGIAAGTLEARPQPVEGMTYAPKLTVEESRVDWSQPAFAVDRLIRSCTPAPGAWTTIHGERLKLGPVLVQPDEPQLAPGELSVQKSRVLVGTGTTPVQLGDVQPLGKRLMPASDWTRGHRLDPSDRLE
ncbi:methionyl-tRNA formyltransferase [Tenggerimyces flavus]|uniref:Methionyl-tRNA formyltransferase n=1 Tax=Tenggerimyces flavus TaxID=1708749 RepID=A0ABV7YDC4_9ACTN|nr:methionyl-tRNA formyltransferase [Tenggerimyces flavus]MBM7788001.1 methionyl-tRNA formyltransferase [Tenggerimyces flavus]